VNALSVKLIDKQFCYCIVKSQQNKAGGAKVFNVGSFNKETGAPIFLDLESAHESLSNKIEYNIDS